MRIFFDHGTPRGPQAALSGRSVETADEKGCDRLANGELLKAAEGDGFELFLTTDRRIQHQQNLKDRKIAILVLTGSTKWTQVRLFSEQVRSLAEGAIVGSYAEIAIPFAQTKARRSHWVELRWSDPRAKVWRAGYLAARWLGDALEDAPEIGALVGVDAFDPADATVEVGAEVGMGFAVLGVETAVDAVGEDGFEALAFFAGDAETGVQDEARGGLALALA
jgi:hypothetical protein